MLVKVKVNNVKLNGLCFGKNLKLQLQYIITTFGSPNANFGPLMRGQPHISGVKERKTIIKANNYLEVFSFCLMLRNVSSTALTYEKKQQQQQKQNKTLNGLRL